MPSTPDLPLLVVDDDADQRRALERLLAPTGWQTVICASAAEALEALKAGSFSVVLSDFRMPGMDGVQLLARVRALCPDAERILMTGSADLDALERGVNEAHISRFLKKPWDPPALLGVLEEAQDLAILRRENAALVGRVAAQEAELGAVTRQLDLQAARHEAAASRARRRWEVALNAIPDPVAVIGEDLRVHAVNLAAAGLVAPGELADQMIGRSCHEALFGLAHPCTGCPLPGGTAMLEHSRDGEVRTCEARAFRLPGGKPTYLVSYRDVAAARASAGSIAHHINNPLHAILAFVQLAQRPDVDPQKIPRYLEVIRESALRCRDFVRSIVETAPRPKEGAPNGR